MSESGSDNSPHEGQKQQNELFSRTATRRKILKEAAWIGAAAAGLTALRIGANEVTKRTDSLLDVNEIPQGPPLDVPAFPSSEEQQPLEVVAGWNEQRLEALLT